MSGISGDRNMHKENQVDEKTKMDFETGDTMLPRAFVLMDFAPEFDAIFEMLIVAAMKEAGFEAFRADNIKSQSNIIRDIIHSIAHSNLIIADLTGSNPNVYYELGIAHGLRRPVVLLTQEISELPFDLKSYRVIVYGTHFTKMDQARRELVELAEEVQRGKVNFGSPVSDFLGPDFHHLMPANSEHKQSKLKPISRELEDTVEVLEEVNGTEGEEGTEGDLGFLDHLVGMEESFDELTKLMNEITEKVNDIGQEAKGAAKELAAAKKRNKPGTARYQRQVVRDLGNKVQAFGEMIATSNRRYRRIQLKAQRSLEAVITKSKVTDEESRTNLRDFLDALRRAEGGATSGRTGIASMAETMRNLDNVEATFTRASASAANELDRLVENVDLTIALINRAREKGTEILGEAGDEAATSIITENSNLLKGDSMKRGDGEPSEISDSAAD